MKKMTKRKERRKERKEKKEKKKKKKQTNGELLERGRARYVVINNMQESIGIIVCFYIKFCDSHLVKMANTCMQYDQYFMVCINYKWIAFSNIGWSSMQGHIFAFNLSI